MIANSTNISARMFKTQRFVILVILSMFMLLLLITGIGAHTHMKNNPDFYNTASGKLSEYYGTAVNTFMGDKNEHELEQQAEAKEQEEAEAAKIEAAAKEAEAENGAAKGAAKDNTKVADEKAPKPKDKSKGEAENWS